MQHEFDLTQNVANYLICCLYYRKLFLFINNSVLFLNKKLYIGW